MSGDLFVGVWTPFRSRWEATTPVCIWNEDGGSYQVRVTGTGSNTDFALLDAGGDSIDYDLRWYRSGTRGQRERLQSGVASRRAYQFASDAACINSDPPHLYVRINDRAVDTATPGIYRDILIITIEPI